MWSIADWENPADCSTPCWCPEIWPGPSCPLHYPACLAVDLGCWILSIWIICENKHNKIIKANNILKKNTFLFLYLKFFLDGASNIFLSLHFLSKQTKNKIETYLSFSLFLLKCTPSMLVPGRSLTSRRSSTIFIFSSSVRHPPNMACSIWRAACSTLTPVALATDCDSPVVRLYRAKKRSSQTTARARLYSLVKSGLLSSLRSPTKNRATKHEKWCSSYHFFSNFTNLLLWNKSVVILTRHIFGVIFGLLQLLQLATFTLHVYTDTCTTNPKI